MIREQSLGRDQLNSSAREKKPVVDRAEASANVRKGTGWGTSVSRLQLYKAQHSISGKTRHLLL